MSTTDATPGSTSIENVDMKIEVVVIPVSDVDRGNSSTRSWGGDSTRTGSWEMTSG